MASQSVFTGEQSTKKRILDSARAIIDRDGIIGLRVTDVAAGAQVSVPLIYRYFIDRDGLLAAVLGDWYDEFSTRYRAMIDSWIDSTPTITLEEFAQLSPKPKAGDNQKDREFRLKVLATALENPRLRERVRATTRYSYQWLESILERGIPKLPEDDRYFDRQIFTLLMFNIMYVFHDALDREPVNDEDYSKFLVGLIRASSRANIPVEKN